MDALLLDLRHGCRRLATNPWFSLMALIALTGSIGANCVVFTIVNAIWLRPSAVPDPDRVVMVLDADAPPSATSDGFFFSASALGTLRESGVFDRVAGQVPIAGGFADNRVTIRFGDYPHEVEATAITSEYFSLTGQALRGRDFVPSDGRPGTEVTAIISHRLWRDGFQQSPAVIGNLVQAEPRQIRIIGIAPPGFHGARLGERTDVWVPHHSIAELSSIAHRSPLLIAFARLKDGIGQTVAERSVTQYWLNQSGRATNFRLAPIDQLYGAPGGRTLAIADEEIFFFAGAMSLLVWLSGCATILTLIVVALERRRQDLAVQVALGSSRGRLVRAIAIEFGVLFAGGLLFAIWSAILALRALPALRLPGGIELDRLDLTPDWRVVSFGLGLALVALLLAGIGPIRRAVGASLQHELVFGSTKTTSASLLRRQFMLGAHVTATTIVIIAALLFVQTVVRAHRATPGFDSERLVFVEARIPPPRGAFRADATEANRQKANDLFRRLRETPGIESVALGRSPIGPDQAAVVATARPVVVDGERKSVSVYLASVSPEYPEVLGLPLLTGRSLGIGDVRPPRVAGTPALVSASLARSLWPTGTALGREFGSYQIVGVVGDVAVGSLRQKSHAALFVASAVSELTSSLQFTVRTVADARVIAESVRREIRATFPTAPTVEVSTAGQVLSRDLGQERLGAWFFSVFGVITLVLGVGGVFGLVAYLADSRRREWGIRLALGATHRGLSATLIRSGMLPVLIGVALGSVGASLVIELTRSQIVGLVPLSVRSLAGASSAIILCSLTATLLAAWRINTVSAKHALLSE